MKPKITKQWSSRHGKMFWTCDAIPEGKWGRGVPRDIVKLWRDAISWCLEQNRKNPK